MLGALSFGALRQSERAGSSGWRMAHRALLALSVLVLTVGAHHGGSLTRGEGYLTRYAPGPVKRWLGVEAPSKSLEDEPESGAEPLVYANVVAPILRARCYDCHGPEEQKGKLRLDSLEAMSKGGKEGAALVPGDSAKSPLVARMLLPEGHDERMPPEDKPGPSPEEIELIRFWVDRGASESLRVKDLLVPLAARSILERGLAPIEAASGSASASPRSSASATATPSAEPTSEPAPSATTSSGPGGVVTTSPGHTSTSLYDARVAPILAARCGKCHGGSKQKGRLSLDSIDAMKKGGKQGPALIAGSAKSSPLITRVQLPLDDDEHMPPAGEPQMTASELAVVAFFVDGGATRELELAALPAHLRGTTAPRPTATSPRTAKPPPTGAPPATSWPTSSPSATATPPASSTLGPPAASSVGPDLAALPPKIDLFADLAHPILVERCGSCHDEEGLQGDLSVETHASLLKGGSSGPAIAPTDPAKSLLVTRMHLPLSDADHMPPDTMEQPTAGEIAAIELWIASGASEKVAVDTATLRPSVRVALAAVLAARPPAQVLGPTPTPSSSTTSGTSPPTATATATSRPPDDTQPTPPATTGGGCASCAVGALAPDSSALGLSLALALALALSWRRGGR
ncbi:MAG: hypothetical protein IPG04_05295 [Polyangiaceae bacterium]|nr:hypothetical protein [Polyangiaceae bacterium]